VELTCDFCKEEDQDLVWDDIHGMFSPGVMYMFLCKNCATINDAFWQISGIKIKAGMEISMNRRAFNRTREEIKNAHLR
jgi:hypothetical protein